MTQWCVGLAIALICIFCAQVDPPLVPTESTAPAKFEYWDNKHVNESHKSIGILSEHRPMVRFVISYCPVTIILGSKGFSRVSTVSLKTTPPPRAGPFAERSRMGWMDNSCAFGVAGQNVKKGCGGFLNELQSGK